MFTLSAIRHTASATLSVVLLSLVASTAQAAPNPHPRGAQSYSLSKELNTELPRHSRSFTNNDRSPQPIGYAIRCQ